MSEAAISQGRNQDGSRKRRSSTQPGRTQLLLLTFFTLATAQTSSAHPLEEGGFPFHDLATFDFLKTGDPLTDWNAKREWVSADGRKLQAKVVSAGEAAGEFIIKAGRRTKIPLSKLSENDRRFLTEWREISEFFDTGYTPARDLGGRIKAAMFEGMYAKEGKVHETRNFRFECDVPLRAELAKDFSRLFEVTHSAISKLPLGLSLHRPDGKKITVKLFSTEGDYTVAGGNKDASGIYLLKEQTVLVPLVSLGIERASNGEFRKTRDFDPRTLIHETTHAVTHHWLYFMPMWLAEGLAEYVASTPYRDGVLDFSKHKSGQRSLAEKKFGGDAERFELFTPETFVSLRQSEFMGGPPEKERPVRLPIIKPYQIELVQTEPNTVAGEVVSLVPQTSTLKPVSKEPDPTVVQRYVSSMLLVDHLIETDPTAFRKYLFSLLHGEWAREKYLKQWSAALDTHEAAVQAQITTFNSDYKSFQRDVDTYNAAVTRHNAGQIVKKPKTPVRPVPPKAVPVPDILAKPRSAEELSRSAMRERALAKHLKIPATLSLPKR